MHLSNWDLFVKAWKEQIEPAGKISIPKQDRRRPWEAPPFPELFDTMEVGQSIVMNAKDAMTFRHTVYQKKGKSILRFVDGSTCRIWITGKGK